MPVKKLFRMGKRHSVLLAFAMIVLVVPAPSFSRAYTSATALTLVNNSSREIRHVYLTPPSLDTWGPDQLEEGTTIVAGGSHTLNVSCEATEIKVILEDEDGCFMNKVIACGENSSWSITNESARDCGN